MTARASKKRIRKLMLALLTILSARRPQSKDGKALAARTRPHDRILKILHGTGKFLALIAVGCASDATMPPSTPPADTVDPVSPRAGSSTLSSELSADSLQWQAATWSPQPTTDPVTWSGCGRRDGALDALAHRIAMRQVISRRPLQAAELEFALRAAGEPHVWPRAWILSGDNLSTSSVAEHWQRFMSSFEEGGERRCGIATAQNRHGERVIAGLALDALADLSPLPMRARLGQWIRIDATMLLPADAAKVIALGPRSAPRALPTSLQDGRIHAVCAVDRSGPWLFQVMADVGGGPRPVLEARVFVDDEPPASFVMPAVPGENAAREGMDAPEAIERMLNAARREERLPPLRRDPRLDAIAQEQATEMKTSGRIAHDLGSGDPRDRVLRAGLNVQRAGENLASAATVQGAHRALWSSPSHRDNLLQSTYDSVGIGVVEDGQGVWVCELFAYFGNAGIEATERAGR